MKNLLLKPFIALIVIILTAELLIEYVIKLIIFPLWYIWKRESVFRYPPLFVYTEENLFNDFSFTHE